MRTFLLIVTFLLTVPRIQGFSLPPHGRVIAATAAAPTTDLVHATSRRLVVLKVQAEEKKEGFEIKNANDKKNNGTTANVAATAVATATTSYAPNTPTIEQHENITMEVLNEFESIVDDVQAQMDEEFMGMAIEQALSG